MMEQEQESALLSELAEGDFSADQNIVEVSQLILFGRGVGVLTRLAGNGYTRGELKTSFSPGRPA